MQTYIARWWQSAPVLSWNEVARQLIARNDLDAADSRETPRAAEPEWGGRGDQLLERQVPLRLLAAVERDHHDVGRWERRAPRPDSTWTALITAPYPEWTSGHNCLDAAHVTVLRMFFGDAPGGFQITSTFVNPGGPAVRTFDTFSQPLAELIEARIWAGLHYRSADVAGQLLGAERRHLRDRELLPAGGPLTIRQVVRQYARRPARCGPSRPIVPGIRTATPG